MANVHQGYRGIAQFGFGGGTYVRFQDGNVVAKQDVNAPDLVMGDWDHDVYNYNKVTVDGSLSGPVTETFASTLDGLFTWAVQRTGDCGELAASDLDIWYYCDSGSVGGIGYRHQTFTDMYANSIDFNCAAGEVAQFTLNLIGKTATAFDTTDAPHYTTAEKLVTWDKTQVTLTPSTDLAESVPVAYSNFSFSVNNNVQALYAIVNSSQNLFPYELIPGIRTITGSLTIYDIENFQGALNWDAYTAGQEGSLAFSIGGSTITMKVRFHRIEPSISAGPIQSTIAFTGVTHQTGSPWV